MNRNLDSAYFRIKRDNKWQNICFSDLIIDERQEVLKDKSAECVKSICLQLADKLKEIGDKFDITGSGT